MSSIIEINKLNKKFDNNIALQNINLSIEENKIYGILGRNGVGKTTLLKVLAGHYIPTDGTISYKGLDYKKNSHVVKNICYVSDRNKFFENFKVKWILADARDCYENWDEDFAQRLIKEFNVPIKKDYRKLSSGMKCFVSIIIGLASRSPITIFDESYVGMDAVNRSLFHRILMDDYMDNPRTIILSTHFMDEVASLFEEVMLIHNGELVENSPIEEIEERAFLLKGSKDTIEKFIPKDKIMHMETMGSFCNAHIDYPLSEELIKKLKLSNIDVSKDSLQNWFVNYILNVCK